LTLGRDISLIASLSFQFKTSRKKNEKNNPKTSDMFLKLGFKSITMDDIASESISKKLFTSFSQIKSC
jgi:hypothetical protein